MLARILIQPLILLTVLFSCTNRVSPTQGSWQDYRLLESRYERGKASGNIYLMANALLAMEKSDVDLVHEWVKKGIENDPQSCKAFLEEDVRIETYYNTNIIAEADKQVWGSIIDLCERELSAEAVDEMRAPLINSLELESRTVDRGLVFQLDTIRYLDQYYRAAKSKKVLYENWNLQHEMDQNNLDKVRAIVSGRGYPSMEEISSRHKNTIWLVLHHQSDCEERKANRSLLVSAVASGNLSAANLQVYDNRSARLCD